MKKKPVRNVGASVRQQLLSLRDKTGEDFNALLTQFAIERFLYRLSRSSLSDRFVLKGAMLFRVWSGSLHRPTKDVDLLGSGEATATAVATTIRQIISIAVEDDGILFAADSVQAEEIRESQEYGGIRVTFTATLEVVSKLSKGNHQTSDFQESQEHLGLALITNDESAEVSEPRHSPFDGPATAVTTE